MKIIISLCLVLQTCFLLASQNSIKLMNLNTAIVIKNSILLKPNILIDSSEIFIDNSKKNEIKKMLNNELIKLSQDLLYAAKTNKPTDYMQENLADYNYDSLRALLINDIDKKTFWINIYNAYTLIQLKQNVKLYEKRFKFFNAKSIKIATQLFSLNDIEHGFLRRSKIWWSFGYLNKFFVNKIEKQLRVKQLDYRIHFALNCGATSCPPIAFYSNDILDQQLNLATKTYLKTESSYDSTTNTLTLPKLISWYKADFKNKKQIIKLCEQLDILPLNKKPKIKYGAYSWEVKLD